VLRQEIEDFLYREAELLDERRYREWLDLLAEDIRYWMPMRRNVKSGEDEREFTRADSDINWFDEGKDTLQRRVKQIETGIHWAEEPRSRLSHLVTNVQVQGAEPSLCRAAGGLGDLPLPDLSQPRRDRDRHPGRPARGFAQAQRSRLASGAAQDYSRSERAAVQEPDVFHLRGRPWR
jgi:hypothetical protein